LKLPYVPWTEWILYRSWGPLGVGRNLQVMTCRCAGGDVWGPASETWWISSIIKAVHRSR
jgi:hypothetical protein